MKTVLTKEQIEKMCGYGFNVSVLHEMLSILPKKITDRRNIYILEISVGDCDSGWNIRYRDRLTGIDDLDTYQESRELIDAIYAMIVWLKQDKDLVWI